VPAPYCPSGDRRNSQGTIGTDKQFTSQILDGMGLYYYNARYYDPGIGRFISPDTMIPGLSNPQALNRYSYVNNNPLNSTDPTGHFSFHINLKTVLKVVAVVAIVVAVVALAVIAAPLVIAAASAAAAAATTAATVVAAAASTVIGAAATAIDTAFCLASAYATVALGTVGDALAGVAEAGTATEIVANTLKDGAPSPELNPPGALGNWNTTTFEEGDTFQRFGDISGHYGAPVGQSADASALSPASQGQALNIYQFNTSWNALQSTVAPQPDWNQTGLGQQFYFEPTIGDLLQGDIISNVTTE